MYKISSRLQGEWDHIIILYKQTDTHTHTHTHAHTHALTHTHTHTHMHTHTSVRTHTNTYTTHKQVHTLCCNKCITTLVALQEREEEGKRLKTHPISSTRKHQGTCPYINVVGIDVV